MQITTWVCYISKMMIGLYGAPNFSCFPTLLFSLFNCCDFCVVIWAFLFQVLCFIVFWNQEDEFCSIFMQKIES